MNNIIFALYAGLIPVVPLVGIEIFKQRKEARKALLCRLLFWAQVALSGVMIYIKWSS